METIAFLEIPGMGRRCLSVRQLLEDVAVTSPKEAVWTAGAGACAKQQWTEVAKVIAYANGISVAHARNRMNTRF